MHFAIYSAGAMLGAALAAGAAIQILSPSNAKVKNLHSDITPKRRGVRFHFEDVDIANWNGYGHFTSLFMNALSMFFPVGEAFFVRAVQAHKEKAGIANDPIMKEQVQGFIAQEALHGREHDRYNDEIKKVYPVAVYIEKAADGVLRLVEKGLGKRMSLATTVALEHWTALMGGALLTTPTIYSTGDPNLGLIWHWHACEETEHKSVAFDVYTRAYGYTILSWIDKAVAQIVATIVLWTMVWVGFLGMIISDNTWWNVKEWYVLLNTQWGFEDSQGRPVGVLRKCVLPLFDYFSPSFHPWQKNHDNSHLLSQMPELEKEIEKLAAPVQYGNNKKAEEEEQAQFKKYDTSA